MLTWLFQLVDKMIDSSRSICTTSPNKIPNQSPCSVPRTTPTEMGRRNTVESNRFQKMIL
jgi:hypothetical protein